MKKILLVGLLVGAAIGAGFASKRWQSARAAQVFIQPHTITYHVTFYDEGEKVMGTSVVVRRVTSDGTWKQTQITPDGNVSSTNGKIKRLMTNKTTDASSPEHLHFRYITHPNNGDMESWISPELQDYLKFTEFRTNGVKFLTFEAVDISTP